jgi:PQ loop repeat
MMILWACAGVPLGVYNIVEDFNVALRIQPQILTTLSLITWAQCKYYGNRWPWRKAMVAAVPITLLMGGIEAGLVFALRKAKADQTRWPIIFMAVLSACLLCAGVGRHYWDIYRTRTVRGISFLFVFIDAMGDLTSLISVFFQPTLDILGMVIYGSELVLWTGVFSCGGWYNLRPWLRKKIMNYRKANSVMSHEGHAGRVEDATASAIDVARLERRSSRTSSTVFRTASGTFSHDPEA